MGKVEFRISVRRQPGHKLDNGRLAISPTAAAKLDEEKFLEFAEEVARVRAMVEAKNSQMELPLGT
jgi:hypothetical protein